MDNEQQQDARRLMATFEKFAKADWRKQTMFGLKPSEMRVLITIKHISREGDCDATVSEISKRLFVTSPTITQMINGLHAGGFVEKTADCTDRRISHISLTAKGEKIVQQINKHVVAAFSGLIEKLGQEQTEQLIDLMDQVFDYFDKLNRK